MYLRKAGESGFPLAGWSWDSDGSCHGSGPRQPSSRDQTVGNKYRSTPRLCSGFHSRKSRGTSTRGSSPLGVPKQVTGYTVLNKGASASILTNNPKIYEPLFKLSTFLLFLSLGGTVYFYCTLSQSHGHLRRTTVGRSM